MAEDPRLTDPAESVNAQLQDRSIRHLMLLSRLSNREARQVARHIDNEITPDLEDQIRRRMAHIQERGFDTGPATTQRLQELFSALQNVGQAGLREIQRRLRTSMEELAQSEAEWQVGAVRSVIPVRIEMAMPSPSQLRQAVLNRPFDGMPLSDWFTGLERSTQQNLEREIRRGIVEGETVDRIARRVKARVMRTTTRQAQAIAHSAVIHTNTQARLATFEENRDIIKGYVWLSTLDSVTCAICANLDQRADDGDGNPLRGHPSLGGRRPPAHVRCRCTLTVLLRSARELGLDLGDLPEGTRASIDGQVPSSLTYNQWLRKQVNAGRMDVVREALGEKRAKLFAAGGLDVQQFVAGGRELTLDQLRAREADVFQRLNL